MNTASVSKVYVGIPTHDNRIGQGMIQALYSAGSSFAKLHIAGTSAVNLKFNTLYTLALNARKTDGITHWLMWHEDVTPHGRGWLDRMVSLMEEHQAGILSAVITLKNASGETSTCIEVENPRASLGFFAKRLTLQEIAEKYPKTFTHEKLLLNTGLMLVDLRQPFAEKIFFEFVDRIIPHPEKPGDFSPVSFSEDYNLTRMARLNGAKLCATVEIPVTHHGGGVWSNQLAPAASAAPKDSPGTV